MGIETAIFAGLSALGTGLQIAGQASQAAAQKEQYEKNLELAKEDAKRVREHARFRVEQLVEQSKEIRAKATVTHAARGLAGGRTYKAAQEKFDRLVAKEHSMILKRAEEQAERLVKVAESGRPIGPTDPTAILGYTSTFLTGAANFAAGAYMMQPQYPRGSVGFTSSAPPMGSPTPLPAGSAPTYGSIVR